MKVLITRRLPGNPETLLRKNGFEVYVHPDEEAMSRDEFLRLSKDVDAVMSQLSETIDKEALDNFTKCKIVANCAVGYNNFNVEYARKKKIILTNTPDVLTNATAEIAVGLILCCARRLGEGERFVREGKFTGWKPTLLLGQDLVGKTLGIIGAGRIGIATARRMKGFGVNIIYFNRSKKPEFEKELGAKKVSLDKLMKTADVISIHVPLNEKTRNLVDKEKLSLMKPTAILVNTARGEVIDEKYLIQLLKKKKIFSAGFDVYEGEPKINPDLLKLENVFLLPHIGSATVETRAKMSLLAAQNVISVLKGKGPLTPIK